MEMKKKPRIEGHVLENLRECRVLFTMADCTVQRDGIIATSRARSVQKQKTD